MALDVNASNRPEDLSGLVLQPNQNPYAAVIQACHDDPKEIQSLYSAHRTKRNAQQRDKFLAADFQGLCIDQTILKLERPHLEPGFRDERNCFVFWARPPEHIIRLAARVQDLLRGVAPGIWLMPTHRMHMTVLEVAFSRTKEEIASLVGTLGGCIPTITSYTYLHRARLVRPMVSYDCSAFAVSFVPAGGEGYTYHHLRRDVFELVRGAGVEVGSRYEVPSAHVTLGRFLDEADHDTPAKRERWVRAVDEVNEWLGGEGGEEWVVGQERGLDARCGTLWYGGGRTILLGEGF